MDLRTCVIVAVATCPLHPDPPSTRVTTRETVVAAVETEAAVAIADTSLEVRREAKVKLEVEVEAKRGAKVKVEAELGARVEVEIVCIFFLLIYRLMIFK